MHGEGFDVHTVMLAVACLAATALRDKRPFRKSGAGWNATPDEQDNIVIVLRTFLTLLLLNLFLYHENGCPLATCVLLLPVLTVE
jgi:hypothetical protein